MSDTAEPLESPRKRQKLFADPHAQLDGAMDETLASNADAAKAASSDDASTGQIQVQKELAVGITEYVSPDAPGFSGILKKRYTDFLVNEIFPSGQVVHLDNLKLPPRRKAAEQSTQTEPVAPTSVNKVDEKEDQDEDCKAQNEHDVASLAAKPSSNDTVVSLTTSGETTGQAQEDGQRFQLSADDEALLESYFGAATVKSILALNDRILASPDAKARSFGTVVSSVITDRELRTNIHKAMRRIFSSRLETSTDNDGAMVISAATSAGKWGSKGNNTRNTGGRDGRTQLKGKLGWQDLGGEYLHFSLYKENKDTMEVVAFLARQLKLNPKSFQFAGTKDRRGVTVQRISVYRVHADKLVALNRSLRGSKIGGYAYHTHGLELGDLTGNEFIITLRDCRFAELENLGFEDKVKNATETISRAMTDLGTRGYINYYGLQRFGTFSTRTDTIGVKMLQGDFKGACDDILSYSDKALAAAQDPSSNDNMISSDDRLRAEALHSFKSTGQAYPALEKLPRKFSAESNIIRHLSHPQRANDYRGALQTIQRNLRLMYVHAYQSLVWNTIASERWKRWGDRLVEGDLVLINEHNDKAGDTAELDQVDEGGELVIHPADEDRSAMGEDHFERARALNKEEVESGKYSIFDIVLPTPGFDILYPSNDLLDFYKSFMASERGGGLDLHDMRRAWKDISLSGSYRKLLACPGHNWSYEIKGYSEDDEQLVETDLDKLQQKGKQESDGQATAKGKEEKVVEDNGSKKLAVILQLQLGSSQYATMALRELMKQGGVQTYKPDFGGGR
ncbi:MAG: hypothetical protein M1812_002176 [Candelaria pacifica]|nr:MAG: hypothetical protein M1812_002176 [Candelaria pacifica]